VSTIECVVRSVRVSVPAVVVCAHGAPVDDSPAGQGHVHVHAVEHHRQVLLGRGRAVVGVHLQEVIIVAWRRIGKFRTRELYGAPLEVAVSTHTTHLKTIGVPK